MWKLCFDDSEAFTDLYFSMRYKDEINRVVRREGKVVSALQAIPYPMTFCGGVVPVSYISGACTHPGFREHGAMRRLLQDTHRRMYDDGVLLGALIPAEEWLFGYYARSGYAPCFGYAAEVVEASSLRPCAVCRVGEETEVTTGLYGYFDARMRERGCCILHLLDDFRIILADLRLGGGKWLVVRREGAVAGMAFCVAGGGKLRVKELLADDGQAADALLWEAARLYGVPAMEVLRPSSSQATECLGMARAINIEGLLSLFALKYPEREWCFGLEGDDALPQNNGYYTVSRGACLRGRLPGREYPVYTIGGFTRMLLEPEHPYMSLMLD